MTKPWWVRVMGWLGVAALVFVGAALYTRPAAGASAKSDLLTMMIGAAGVIVLCGWGLISALLWVVRKNAAAQAAAQAQALQARPPVFPSPAVGKAALPVELPLAETGIVCGQCGNARGVLHCCTHVITLCWRCAVRWDGATCAYRLANRYEAAADALRERARTAVTSPLSGAR